MAALLKDLEEVFSHSEQRVLAAFVAVKCDPTTSGGRSRRALPKSTGKPRILCLTAKRRTKKRGFKGTLHVCKLSQGRYQVRKSVRLKLLTRVEAFVDSPGEQEYFELTFLQRGFTSGESRLAFEVRNAAVRLELLGTLYTFCSAHEKQAPQVLGIEVSELEASAAQYNKQVSKDSAGQTAKVLLKEAVRQDAGGSPGLPEEEEEGDAANPLWGQREDRQIQSLLEMVSGGAASMEELQQRLETELAALEDASVHEILENGASVTRVLGTLGGALGLLEDLEQNLAIFDAKLRHMREDIAAIEDRNNQLELHSRNNQKLLGALEGLVGRLTLPETAERALQAREITPANLAQSVEAAWVLHARLQSLHEQPDLPAAASAASAAEGGGLPRGMANMAAVAAQRQRLYGLQRLFVDKAAAYLQQELAHIADLSVHRLQQGPLGGASVASLSSSRSGGGARQAASAPGQVLPDHSSLRRRAAELAPLLEVVGALRPAAVVAPREAYCQAVNALLRQEVHAAAAEVKRMAAAADAGGAQEPDLLARPSATEAASTLERLSVAPGRSPRLHSSGRDLSAAYRQAGIIPIHEGYQSLLDSQLPVLAEECAQCIALMFPKALPAVQAAAAGTTPGGASAAAAPARAVRFAGGEGGAGAAAAAAAAAQPGPVDPGSKEVQSTVASLLIGIDAELLGLIDGVKPGRAVLCLPMLGATLAWKQRLAAQGAACRPLAALVGRAEERLSAALGAYFRERTAAIQRYDGRSSSIPVGGSGAKGQHVLPFIFAFPSVAGRIEELLERWPAQQPAGAAAGASAAAAAQHAADERTPETRPSGGRASAGDGASRQPQPFPSPFESSSRPAQESTASELSSSMARTTDDTDDISFMESEGEGRSRRTTDASAEGEAAAAAAGRGGGAVAGAAAAGPQAHQQQQEPRPGDVLRELVDGGYEAWLGAMGAAVEALGASDAKHGARLRMENYAFLQLALQGLPLGRSSALEGFATQATSLLERATGSYVDQQIEHIKLTRLLDFTRRLDEMLGSVGAEEVHLQPQFQPAEVRQLLAAAAGGLDKKLVQVYQRVLKHLAATSPHLVDPVWHRLESVCLQRWARLEQQLAKCYRGMELRPTAAELRRQFAAAKAAGAAAG